MGKLSESTRVAAGNAIAEALSLSESIERGQAVTPLSDLFRELQGELHGSGFPVAMLALGPAAKTRALEWLYGQKFAVLSAQVSTQIGLLEIQLREHGYLLEGSDGRRQEFDDLDAFQAAIAASDLLSRPLDESLRHPPQFAAQAAGNARHLKVMLPDNAQLVRDHPALLTRLVRSAALLVIIAEPEYSLTESDRVVIQDLLAEIPAAWPMLLVDELADASLPNQGWWKSLRATLVLPPRLLTTHVAAPMPQFFTEIDDPQRELLRQLHLLHRVQLARQALADHYEQTLQQLQVRHKREKQRGEPVDGNRKDNAGEWNTLRNRFAQEVQRVQKLLEERSRRRLLPGSDHDNRIRELTEGIRTEDISLEKGYKTSRMVLDERLAHAFEQEMRQLAKQALREDIALMDQEVKGAFESGAAAALTLAGHGVTLDRPALDEREIWADLKESMHVEFRYAGEMRNRGVLERIGEGRRTLFVLLMLVSMLGYFGVNLRNSPLLPWLMGPAFLAAVAWSYYAWRREDRQHIEKELAKVRNEALQVARRLVSELERLKLKRLGDYLDRARNAAQQQLEAVQSNALRKQDENRSSVMQQAKQRSGALEQKLTDWRNLRPRIDNVQRLIADALTRTRAELDTER